MTSIGTGRNSIYWMTNLLLADALARRLGNSRHAAINRCARRGRDDAKDPWLADTLKELIGKDPHMMLLAVHNMQNSLIESRMLRADAFYEISKDGKRPLGITRVHSALPNQSHSTRTVLQNIQRHS